MARRSYDQHCPVARSLDLLGERWTLLILRDLIAGPRRYTDLRNGLNGIPSDILTQRLRDLEAADVIARRKLPPPAASTVYELTERGRELEPVLVGLARFGFGLLEEGPRPAEGPTPERLALLLKVLFDPDSAPAETETVVLDSGDSKLAISFGGGRFNVRDGESLDRAPAATLHADPATLFELITGKLEFGAALGSGDLQLSGEGDAALRMQQTFPAPAEVRH